MFKENIPEQPKGNILENEMSFTDKILPFQIQYAVNVFEKKIPPPYKEDLEIDFESYLKRFSDISTPILNAYEKRTGIVPGEGTYETYEVFEKEVLSKIKEIYEKQPDKYISLIPNIIQQETLRLPEGKPASREFFEKEENQVDLLHFNIQDSIRGLEKFGLTENDEMLLIHIDPLVNSKKQNDSINVFSYNSLVKTAELIKEKCPFIKGIVLESWVVDSPIGKRVGFHEFESRFKNFYHGDTFWGQFYDQNGNVKEKEMKQFLDTGIPPFKTKGGFMSIEEFLQKYLPK